MFFFFPSKKLKLYVVLNCKYWGGKVKSSKSHLPRPCVRPPSSIVTRYSRGAWGNLKSVLRDDKVPTRLGMQCESHGWIEGI